MSDSIIYTPDEVAAELKIAKNTVYELIKRGELPAYKVGRQVRIDASDLELYKQKGKKQNSGFASSNMTNTSKNESSDSGELIISGKDTLLDILANNIQKHPFGTPVLRSNVCSFSGLISLYYDKCHIAATHLLDFETQTYNVSYVKKLVPGIPCIIIHLAKRKQGLYVQKGNPKQITGWEHLKRNDITMINREKGSGTRVLLDQYLNSLLMSPSELNGYYKEETSHLGVANAVANGIADVALGCENAIRLMKNVEFIPLQEESYDIVIKKENLSNPVYKLIFEMINSDEFRDNVNNLGGYNIEELGSIIAET